MGTMSYSVDIEVPSGFDGATPSFSLAYSSGAGSGPLGIGWSMAVPYIERMTRKGLPEYDDADDFVADGGTELIQVDTAEPATYRARFEGAFIRYQWHERGLGDEGYWTAEYPDGSVGYFGADRSGTNVETARVRSPNGVYRYLLVEMVDVWGHGITYDYAYYGSVPLLDFVGWAHDGGGTPRFSVTFDYETRDDKISDARGGFNELLSHRLSALQVWSGGSQVRSYTLSYEDSANAGYFSRLQQVTQYGADGTAYPVEMTFGYTRALSGVCDGIECEAPYLTTMNSIGVDLQSGKATLIDLNGDSLPDMIHTPDGQPHRIFLSSMAANGNHSFGAAVNSVLGSTTGHDLASAYVQVLDYNGDGFVDLVSSATAEVLVNQGNGDWETKVLLGSGSGTGTLPDFGEEFDLSADTDLKHIRFMDYDGDRRIDVVRATDAGTEIFKNIGNGGFQADPNVQDIGASFATDNMEFADMNGDGLLDPVIVRDGQVSYRINLGWGQWAAWTDINNAPVTTAELPFASLEDLNGDGIDDLVVVVPGEIRYALNRNGAIFDVIQSVTTVSNGSVPDRDSTTSVLFADMNANGSNDAVWVTSSGEITYLELFPVRPHLLSRVENGIGMVTEVAYGTGVEHRSAQMGIGWDHPIPTPMLVVNAIDTYAVSISEPDIVHDLTTYTYSAGYYDGDEKKFSGFAEVQEVKAGDDFQEETTIHRVYDVGEPDLSGPRPHMAGRMLLQTTSGEDGDFGDQSTTWELCDLADIPPALTDIILWTCATATQQVIKEGRPQTEWVEQSVLYTYDGYGNVVRKVDQGVTSIGGGGCGTCLSADHHSGACGGQCLGDEIIVDTTFVPPLSGTSGKWILGAPLKVEETFLQNGDATEMHHRYDGEAFVGMPEGTLEFGGETRVFLRDPGTGAEIDIERHRLNEHGRSVESLDAEGDPSSEGNRINLVYDASGLDLIREEKERGDITLVRDITWHALFDRVTSVTEWYVEGAPQGPQTHFGFDEFGRLIAKAKPGGDTLMSPTEVFTYELGNPVSRIRTQTRSEVGGPLDLEAVSCIDGLGRLYQTRDRLEAGRWQVGSTTAFNRRGLPVRVHQAYEGTTGDCDATLSATTPAVRYRYDGLGRILEYTEEDAAIYGSDSVQTNIYTPLSVAMRDSLGSESGGAFEGSEAFEQFDGQGRLIASGLRFANGVEEEARFGYDDFGNLSLFRDRSGRDKIQTWDAFGRITRVADPDRGVTQYTHDDNGNILTEARPTGETIASAYDGLDRLVAQWDAADESGTKRTWTWDLDADCPTCSDNADGLVGVDYPLLDGNWGKDRLEFDLRGRVVRVTREVMGVEMSLLNAYDNADRIKQVTYPDGRTVDLDLQGTSLVTGIPGFVPNVTYDPRGRPESIGLVNGVTETRTLDVRQRLSRIEVSGTNADVVDINMVWGRSSGLDAVTDNLGLSEPGQNAAFTYDAFGRLTAADLDSGGAHAEGLTYSFDNGDLGTKSSTLTAASRAHVGNITWGGATSAMRAATGATGYDATYDAAGQMITRNGLSFERNAHGQVTRVLDGADVKARYGYGVEADRVVEDHGAHFKIRHSDAFEIRDGIAITRMGIDRRALVEVASDALQTQFFNDDGDGVINAKDAWLGRDGDEKELDRLLQGSARRMLLGDTGEKKTYLHRNHLGSVIATTDEAGNVNERMAYHPYGTLRWASAGTHTEAACFGELVRDPTTGLHYAGARDYDPLVGRWTSPDPAFDRINSSVLGEQRDLQGAYVYVDGRPTRAIDKQGRFLDPMTIGAIVGGITGALAEIAMIRAENRNLPPERRTGWKKAILKVLKGAALGAFKGFFTMGGSAAVDAGRAVAVVVAENKIAAEAKERGGPPDMAKRARWRRNIAIVGGAADLAVSLGATAAINGGLTATEVVTKAGTGLATTAFIAHQEHHQWKHVKKAVRAVKSAPGRVASKFGKWARRGKFGKRIKRWANKRRFVKHAKKAGKGPGGRRNAFSAGSKKGGRK
jgi:RHS repeat-associated protein